MARVSVRRTWRERAVAGMLFVTLTPFAAGPVSAQEPGKNDGKNDHQQTETPIKHVIVLIGENRTFDHLFATYVPQSRDSVKNLLSEGIIKADGTPGKNFGKAAQFQAIAPFKTKFYISLDSDDKAPYSILPEPSSKFFAQPCDGRTASVSSRTSPRTGSHRAVPRSRGSRFADHRGVRGGTNSGVSRSGNWPDSGCRYASSEFRSSSKRALPAGGTKSALRFLHGRFDAPALRDVATIRLQHAECHAGESVGLLERPLSFRHLQLYERA